MWENTSEGSPISPVCKTHEKLADWLVQNKASAGAYQTASRKKWLDMIKGPGSSLTGVMDTRTGIVRSGISQDHKPEPRTALERAKELRDRVKALLPDRG